MSSGDFLLPSVTLVPDLAGIPQRLEAIESWLVRHELTHERIGDKVEDHSNRIERLETAVRNLVSKVDLLITREQMRDPGFVDHMRALGLLGGNPYDPKRRNELLDKYVQSMMTMAEAKEFRGYLVEDLRMAPEDKKAIVMWAIIGVEALMDLIRLAHERQAQTAN